MHWSHCQGCSLFILRAEQLCTAWQQQEPPRQMAFGNFNCICRKIELHNRYSLLITQCGGPYWICIVWHIISAAVEPEGSQRTKNRSKHLPIWCTKTKMENVWLCVLWLNTCTVVGWKHPLITWRWSERSVLSNACGFH